MRTIVVMALVLMAAAGQAVAENSEQAAPPKCVTAEINPVTGRVFCIKPARRAGRGAARGGQGALQAGLPRPVDLVAQLHARARGNVKA